MKKYENKINEEWRHSMNAFPNAVSLNLGIELTHQKTVQTNNGGIQ
jgi:hypothetical protein